MRIQKYLRDNSKKLMSIFGALLMVVFLIPSYMSRNSGGGDTVIGSIGDQKITRDQVRDAEDEWEYVVRHILIRGQGTGQQQWQSIANILPQELDQSMRSNPEAYFLLKTEATRMGLTPRPEEAVAMLSDTNSPYAIAMLDNRIIPFANIDDESIKNNVTYSLANLVMVMNAFERAATVVKVSQPLINHELALRLQEIKSRVVDFSAKQYEDKVPAPTADQLKKQFDQFVSFESGQTSNTNPFGFGYKYPNRVKLQYLTIPRAQARQVVKASKDDYGWEVDANRYYIEHQSEFPTTAPATTGPSMVLLPAKPGATTKPFDEVKESILSRIIEPQVDRLVTQIQSDLGNRMTQDFQTYQATPLNGSTTNPTTSPAQLAFQGFEYIQKLAQDVQTKYKVTLTIDSIADDFKTAAQLRELPGLGKVPSLPDYVTNAAEPFVTPEMKTAPGIMHLYQPSRPVTDDDQNIFIFRITAADPAHQPAKIDEVKDQIEQDWKRATAFDLAKQDATKLLDAARGPGLDVAAGGDKLITTGFYSVNTMIPIDNYKLSTESQGKFARSTYELMAVLSKKDGTRPITLVELPADMKVAVAELIAIQSNVSDASAGILGPLLSQQVQQQFVGQLAQNWFNYGSLVNRIGYKDESGRKQNPTPAPQPPGLVP
ncbi:MAG TPA: hypothetical protein VHD56_00650 [Tepidisphaeraceae bacterium]|nr:hypothetical protein [Tepidisphaeraceae bacterium]